MYRPDIVLSLSILVALLTVVGTATAGNEGVVAAAFLDVDCTGDPECAAIFADGFESGDLSAWSDTVPLAAMPR